MDPSIQFRILFRRQFKNRDGRAISLRSDTARDENQLLFQAILDATLAPNGDAVLIDTGKTNEHAENIADYLVHASRNGVGKLKTVGLLYSTHYDADQHRRPG